MIYLKFSKTNYNVLAKKIEKPRFFEDLKNFLLTISKENIATLCANEIDNYISTNMEFPEENTIYQQKDEFLWKFNKKTASWENTGKKESEYIIDSTNSIWNCFENDFKFLNPVKKEIKNIINLNIKHVFNEKYFFPVTSIDYTKPDAVRYSSSNFISIILSDFFPAEEAKKFEIKIKELLFGNTNNSIFLITNSEKILTTQEQTVFILQEDKVISVNSSTFKKIEDLLSTALEETELKLFIRLLKNTLCFGIPALKYDIKAIITSDENASDKIALANYNGHNFKLVDNNWCVYIDNTFYNLLCKKIKSIIDAIYLKSNIKHLTTLYLQVDQIKVEVILRDTLLALKIVDHSSVSGFYCIANLNYADCENSNVNKIEECSVGPDIWVFTDQKEDEEKISNYKKLFKKF